MTPHGGQRTGAGRKSRSNAKRHNVYVSNRVWEYLREQGRGNVSLGVELVVCNAMYGNVFVDGQYLILTDQADHTNRVLSADSLNYYSDDEYFEMSAPALNGKGERYTVYWIFRNHEDWELDQYDYSKPDRAARAD